GPTRKSACTSSTASSPSPSPTSCAAKPTTPACTCPYVNCSTPWPASARPSCSTTTAAKAAPAPDACSPTRTPPSNASPTCSTSPATPPAVDKPRLGNTARPTHAHPHQRKLRQDQNKGETQARAGGPARRRHSPCSYGSRGHVVTPLPWRG